MSYQGALTKVIHLQHFAVTPHPTADWEDGQTKVKIGQVKTEPLLLHIITTMIGDIYNRS